MLSTLEPMQTTDVLVVGAGPAGTAAAIELRRGQRDVIIVDKARFPRDKCCGDGLTTDALRQLEALGLDPAVVPNWNGVTDIVIHSPRGREVRLPLPHDGQFAAVVPRLDLDQAMVELASAAGAQLRDGVAFHSLDDHEDHLVVHTSHGPIACRYLVAADGMWSPVRKHLGLDQPGYRGEWHAFRQYFSHVGPAAQHLVVWFEPDLLPGYAWSFPLPGQRANVGFGIHRSSGVKVGDMGRIWADLLERPAIRDVLGADAVPEDRHKAWPIPARVDGLARTAHRVFFVGDAVAATDPMTGEGIAQALLTGRAAAGAVLHAGATHPQQAAERYQRHLDRDLTTDHRFARALAKLLEHPLGARGALRAADLNAWTRRNFARWMFEDYPRAAVLTPRRWHRGMFTGAGAYRQPQPATPATLDPADTPA